MHRQAVNLLRLNLRGFYRVPPVAGATEIASPFGRPELLNPFDRPIWSMDLLNHIPIPSEVGNL